MAERKTIETYRKTMNETEPKLEALISKYNGLDPDNLSEDDPKPEDVMKEIEDCIADFNEASWRVLVLTVFAADEKMKKACEIFAYDVLRLTDKNIGDKDNPIFVKAIVKGEKAIDLFKLNKEVDFKLGASDKWGALINKFNMLMTIRVTQDIKGKDTADMKLIASTITHTFKIPAEVKDQTFVADLSGKKMVQALQLIVDAMFGEDVYKVTTHDTKFIEWQYGKKSKNRRCITCASVKELGRILLNVGNKLVTGTTYEAESKHLK